MCRVPAGKPYPRPGAGGVSHCGAGGMSEAGGAMDSSPTMRGRRRGSSRWVVRRWVAIEREVICGRVCSARLTDATRPVLQRRALVRRRHTRPRDVPRGPLVVAGAVRRIPPVSSVGRTEPKQRVRVERPPVPRIAPHPAHAFARVEDEASLPLCPYLRGDHFAHRPLHAVSIHHDMGVLLVGRAAVGRKHVTVCIYAPGHQGTYDCAGGTAMLTTPAPSNPHQVFIGSFVPRHAQPPAFQTHAAR